MAESPELPPTRVLHLYGAEFRRGADYVNRRTQGSGDWLLIYTAAGAGLFRTAAGRYIITPGQAVLYAPGDLQDYRTDPETGRWTLRWTHFMPLPHWQPWLQWPIGPGGLRLLRLDDLDLRRSFGAALQRMIRVQHREVPLRTELAANALEEALLWARVAAMDDQRLELDHRVQRAIDYLAAHLKDDFRLATLARHCGLSVSRLAHVFKAQIGQSPQQFLEGHRMRRASQLLRLTALSMAEVAAEAGFDDAFYFSKRFRRWSGRAPTVYRAEGRKNLREPFNATATIEGHSSPSK